MTTDPLQAAPLTDEELKEIRGVWMGRGGLWGKGSETIRRLLATIDHLKSSAERTVGETKRPRYSADPAVEADMRRRIDDE